MLRILLPTNTFGFKLDFDISLKDEETYEGVEKGIYRDSTWADMTPVEDTGKNFKESPPDYIVFKEGTLEDMIDFLVEMKEGIDRDLSAERY